jgi:hypothetical protein
MVPMDIGQQAVRISNAACFADFLDSMPAPNSAAPALSLKDVNRIFIPADFLVRVKSRKARWVN